MRDRTNPDGSIYIKTFNTLFCVTDAFRRYPKKSRWNMEARLTAIDYGTCVLLQCVVVKCNNKLHRCPVLNRIVKCYCGVFSEPFDPSEYVETKFACKNNAVTTWALSKYLCSKPRSLIGKRILVAYWKQIRSVHDYSPCLPDSAQCYLSRIQTWAQKI